jgi:chromosome partitioning protein
MIVAVFNPKGGVGKTTTAVNIASSLARNGQSVLLVDLEADMNASISLGIRPADATPSIAAVLLHEARVADAVRTIDRVPGLHLITGSPALADMEARLRHVRQPERRLADALRPLAGSFDMILLDCPAGFATLSMSVPAAADHLIVPIRTEYLSLESLAHFFRWYRDHRRAHKSIAQIAGVILTMVEERRQSTREIVDIIRVHNRRGVFRTEIPMDARAAEAPSHGIPLIDFSRSKAAAAYIRLTGELLERLRRRVRH